MARVIVIDEALPHPPDSGKRIRTWELMRRLAADFDITFVHHEEKPDTDVAREAFRAADIHCVPVARPPLVKRGPQFAWDLARNLVTSDPYMVMAHRTRAMQETVARLAAEQDARLVHAEWTPLVANLSPDLGLPVVIAAHNVETQIWERYLENETNPAKRAYIALQVKKLRRFEKEALHDADHVIAVSDPDGDRIRRWAGQPNVTVAPNGVDPETFAVRPDAPVRPASLLFVGSLDWRPNLDAVTWFLDAIWPILRSRVPGASFTVVGRHPPDWLRQRVQSLDGVRVEASVPDVRPYVASAAVSIVPLRIGGGSRLKICEALSMERPVVSTTVGAEGLHLGDGIAIADDAEAFAAAVAEAFADPETAQATAERGRRRVLETHSWDVIAPRQAEAWRKALASVSDLGSA